MGNPSHFTGETGVLVCHTGETQRHLREMEKYVDKREYDNIRRLSLENLQLTNSRGMKVKCIKDHRIIKVGEEL